MAHRERLNIIEPQDLIDFLNLIGFSGRFDSRKIAFDYHPDLFIMDTESIANDFSDLLIETNQRYDSRKTAFDYHPNLYIIEGQDFLDVLDR